MLPTKSLTQEELKMMKIDIMKNLSFAKCWHASEVKFYKLVLVIAGFMLIAVTIALIMIIPSSKHFAKWVNPLFFGLAYLFLISTMSYFVYKVSRRFLVFYLKEGNKKFIFYYLRGKKDRVIVYMGKMSDLIRYSPKKGRFEKYKDRAGEVESNLMLNKVTGKMSLTSTKKGGKKLAGENYTGETGIYLDKEERIEKIWFRPDNTMGGNGPSETIKFVYSGDNNIYLPKCFKEECEIREICPPQSEYIIYT